MFFKKYIKNNKTILSFCGLKLFSKKRNDDASVTKKYLCGLFKKEKTPFGKQFYLFGIKCFSVLNQRKLYPLLCQKTQIRDNNDVPSFARAVFDVSKTPKAVGKLRQKQDITLYLLKNLANVCERAGAAYWLRGGSLLGAVRHGGFIP